MNERYVLDSSAVLCLIDEELGSEKVASILAGSMISAVNLAEVVAKLQERGGTDAMIDASMADLDVEIVDFDTAQAVATGKLRNLTRSRGLSLGDRACLALAASRDAIAVTTDRAWQNLNDVTRVLLVR